MQRTTTLLVFSLLVVMMAGCRSYGGYGSEEALYRQIERASNEFVQDLERIRAEQGALHDRLSAQPGGGEYVEALESAIRLHETLIEQHQEMLEELDEGSGHRALSRAYGAMITDQEMVRGMYRRMHNVAAREGDELEQGTARLPYTVMPAYYLRRENGQSAFASAAPSVDTTAAPMQSEEPETMDGAEPADVDTTEAGN